MSKPDDVDPKKELYRDGLTIRDHFAGRALQAMLSLAVKKEEYILADRRRHLAVLAYEMADAMLEVRTE